MRSSARAYSILFFLSGATGLVYELLWVRILYQTFGSTIQSVTTVVAAYMGGLGLGAWLLGRRADRHPQPAALYGGLEIAIGAFGLVSPLLLALAHRMYVGAAGAWQLSGATSLTLRFGLAALVLLVPTTLMGGTLPVLTRAFMGTDRGALKPSLGRLYALNTLGAVVGTGLAGFVLIEYVGIRASLWATAALNLAIGAIALRLPDPRAVAPVQPASQPAPDPGRLLRRTALALLALTAFASLLDEIAWTRVLVMIVGASTYAFTLVLLVFLLGIGAGSAVVARRGGAPSETAADTALAQAVTAAGAGALFVCFGLLPRYIIAIFQAHSLGASERLLAMGLAVGVVVLIPALGMGMTLPLLTDLAAPLERARGADVGRAYALNTLGGIAGAVLTGFVLIAALGTDLTLRLGVVINGLAALGLAVLVARGVAEGSEQHRRLRLRIMGAGGLATAALVAAGAGPRWSTRLIDLGPSIYAREPMSAAVVQAFLEHRGARQLAFKEGRNATVSVWEGEPGRTLKINGKVDASDGADMDTQVMLGLAPVAARPGAATALVIGFGSGVTARVLADVPGMQRVRVVEIEPAVLEMGRYFAAVNDSVLSRPTVSAVVDDARSALQLERERYDVIVSEPSNPWFAGVATLYSPEFFRVVRSRLTGDGVFCQWLQTYQLPLGVVASVAGGVRAVFPHVQVWFGSPGDLMILGSDRPFQYDSLWLARLIGPTGALAFLAREYLGIDAPSDYFGRFLLGDSGVARLAERATVVHRDDRPRLEFVAARGFLETGVGAEVFDSLVSLGSAGDWAEGGSPLLLAKALAARRWDPTGLAYVDAARARDPRNPFWTVQSAGMQLALGRSAPAESALARLLAGGREPDARLLLGLVALRHNQTDPARELLRQALTAGADTAETLAALAVAATRAGRWADGESAARAAFTAARGTLRHPYPQIALAEALNRIAFHGPPREAERLLAEAVRNRPGWATLHELYAVAALRVGDCDVAAEHLLVLLEFGIERPRGPEEVMECRRGEKL